ncbi:hypothetical protein [Phocaeicola massiliensis]|uniref:Uncharacterized protein n=1 Tax=Phocaeicola massiliensis B84634 = Timone 84634 = DSM 17679 = JCM 13223 TaxID=1121098 RepID=U6RLB3_9BACT|nr:hypothetical protein [Phocaeicola massiliensis]EOA56536.1 hypothetical protein HMPREF1534_01113 [Phocaeicola massiliensis B84634 = Timone 84634 = DSM 17679 = JCM 13223]MDQ7677180.1 hypothetical protein [Phocaeicola massiliensis]
MEKIYGTKKRQDCLVRTGRSKWILFYGFGKDDENSENGWEYRHTFDHKRKHSIFRLDAHYSQTYLCAITK